MSIPELHQHERVQRQRVNEKARSAKLGTRSWLYPEENWVRNNQLGARGEWNADEID